MAQTLGDARPPMHHLIMGGLAPYGAWRQVTFLWRLSLPRTLCLAVCKTQCSRRARAEVSVPHCSRAQLGGFLAALHCRIRDWLMGHYFALGAT